MGGYATKTGKTEAKVLGPKDLMMDLCTLVYGDLGIEVDMEKLQHKVGFYRDPLRPGSRVFCFNFGGTNVTSVYRNVKAAMLPHLFDPVFPEPEAAYDRKMGRYHQILLEKGYAAEVLETISCETIVDVILCSGKEGSQYVVATKYWFAWLYGGCINIDQM